MFYVSFFFSQTNHIYPNFFRALCNMKHLMTILARQILFVRPLIRWKKWGKLDESLPNMQSMLLFSIRKVKYFEIRFWFLTDFWSKRKKIPCKTQDQNQTNKLIKLLKSEHGISYKLEFYHDLLERLLQNSFKFSLRSIMLSALDNHIVMYIPWIIKLVAFIFPDNFLSNR